MVKTIKKSENENEIKKKLAQLKAELKQQTKAETKKPVKAKKAKPKAVAVSINAITNGVSKFACAYITITPNPPPSLPDPIINSPTIAPITDNPADILNPAKTLGIAAGKRSLKKLTKRD